MGSEDHRLEADATRTEKNFPTRRRGRILRRLGRNYGFGDEPVVVVVEVLVPGDEPVFTVVLDSVEVPPAGDDLSITVVLFSVFFSPGGLVTVVSFCSQAARKATLMRMQMYFIISGIRSARSDCASRETEKWLWLLWWCLPDWM